MILWQGTGQVPEYSQKGNSPSGHQTRSSHGISRCPHAVATWLKITLPTCSRRIPITSSPIMSLVFLSTRWLAASLMAGLLLGPGAGEDLLGLWSSPDLEKKSSIMSHMSSLHQLGPCWFPAFRLMSICLYVYMSICLYVYVSICLYVYMSICLYVYMSICLYV